MIAARINNEEMENSRSQLWDEKIQEKLFYEVEACNMLQLFELSKQNSDHRANLTSSAAQRN